MYKLPGNCPLNLKLREGHLKRNFYHLSGGDGVVVVVVVFVAAVAASESYMKIR